MPTVLVSAAVLVESGRVLLARRKPGSHLGGLWEFPGGKVEDGEDPRDALRRELREEIGVDTEIGTVVDVAYWRYPDRTVLLLFYEARARPGSPPPRAIDAAEVRWTSADELRSLPMPPADVTVVEAVCARLRAGAPGEP